MKRILQLVTCDEPGGVQVLTETVRAGLVSRGHHVDTLALTGAGQSPWRIVRALATNRYDAVLSYHVAASLLGSLVGALLRVPVRATHITAIPSAMHRHWRLLDRLWGTTGLHTAIVSNSTATEAEVAHYPAGYRERLVLIPHGVPPLPPPTRANWRARLGLPADATLLVASGRLVSQKDHRTAVATLPLLPGAQLAIAGTGVLGPDLTAQAEALGVSQRLHLLGNLDRGDLAGLLGEADIYLFPSLWESFGLAGVEAAMLGVPLVAADLPVLREVLNVPQAHGMAAFHAPGDETALARAVRSVIAQPPDPDTRHGSARATAAAHGTARMTDLYCRLIETPIA